MRQEAADRSDERGKRNKGTEHRAARLKERRLLRALTMQELADLLGLKSKSSIRDYEHGTTAVPARLWRKIARVLWCAVLDFSKPPESPWTERKPRRRKVAPLRVHSPVKCLDVVDIEVAIDGLIRVAERGRLTEQKVQAVFFPHRKSLSNWEMETAINRLGYKRIWVNA